MSTPSLTAPSLTAHWFLPTYGDGRHLVGGGHGIGVGSADGVRPASIGYLTQVARAAEQVGFAGALTPTGAWCEDAWLTTAMLVSETERLKFLVAFRPGVGEGVLPLLRQRGIWQPPDRHGLAAGESRAVPFAAAR